MAGVPDFTVVRNIVVDWSIFSGLSSSCPSVVIWVGFVSVVSCLVDDSPLRYSVSFRICLSFTRRVHFMSLFNREVLAGLDHLFPFFSFGVKTWRCEC